MCHLSALRTSYVNLAERKYTLLRRCCLLYLYVTGNMAKANTPTHHSLMSHLEQCCRWLFHGWFRSMHTCIPTRVCEISVLMKIFIVEMIYGLLEVAGFCFSLEQYSYLRNRLLLPGRKVWKVNKSAKQSIWSSSYKVALFWNMKDTVW